MMSCILRIGGELLNVDKLLAECVHPEVDRIWKKGEPRSQNKLFHTHSGVSFVVSDADIEEVNLQVEDAVHYLEKHAHNIAKMVAYSGIEYATMDFGFCIYEDSVMMGAEFPPKLIQLATIAGVGLEVSIYKSSKED